MKKVMMFCLILTCFDAVAMTKEERERYYSAMSYMDIAKPDPTPRQLELYQRTGDGNILTPSGKLCSFDQQGNMLCY